MRVTVRDGLDPLQTSADVDASHAPDLLGGGPLQREAGSVVGLHGQVGEDAARRETHLAAFGVQQRHNKLVHCRRRREGGGQETKRVRDKKGSQSPQSAAVFTVASAGLADKSSPNMTQRALQRRRTCQRLLAPAHPSSREDNCSRLHLFDKPITFSANFKGFI